MSPIPDENQDNPSDYDPDKDPEELETPDIIPPVGDESSSEGEDDSDMEAEGANDGYMPLPQEPEEDGGGGDSVMPPLPQSVEASIHSDESMTEVRGAGVDISESVAQGNVHPAFMANYPDNKVPVHLQMPDRPRDSKQEALWNQPRQENERLQLDSAQVSKVKSAMAGFKLPTANIPDWARQVSEDQWKQQLFSRLGPAQNTSSITPSDSSGSATGPPQKSDSPADGDSAGNVQENQ
ncbi:hypothetical protein BaRGS_00001844 [Batillaria attramentaria]|uniref:Male-enhanced antigen 1 n=1 Tax=Batillaria attramentaria TaxID=370345 RepID=A0ABD0M5E4_9CAEN